MPTSFKILASVAWLLLRVSPVIGQTNLVPNPSFEEFNSLPSEMGQVYLVRSWRSANPGKPHLPNSSPDYFHIEGQNQARLPGTAFGRVHPYRGKAVAGFVAYNGFLTDFREYLTVPLSAPLQPGEKYRITFYLTNGQPFDDQAYNVHLGDGRYLVQDPEGRERQQISKYHPLAHPYHTIEESELGSYYGRLGVNGIGVLLTDSAINQRTHERPATSPQLFQRTSFFSATWQKISFAVEANSEARYLTIGNFLDDKHLQYQDAASGGEFAYYFVDEVSVVPIEQEQLILVSDTLVPDTLAGREIQLQDEVNVNLTEIELKVYDPKTKDGDIISLNFNGEWLVEEQMLTTRPIRTKIQIKPYQANYLVLHAHNLGKIAPNTAMVSFKIGRKKYNLSLFSGLKKSGTVIFYYIP